LNRPATGTIRDRLHPRLTRRTCWIDHTADLPIIEGTLIRLQVQRLPGDRHAKPMWLWSSHTLPPYCLMWIGLGRRSYAGPTWSTPSGCQTDPGLDHAEDP